MSSVCDDAEPIDSWEEARLNRRLVIAENYNNCKGLSPNSLDGHMYTNEFTRTKDFSRIS